MLTMKLTTVNLPLDGVVYNSGIDRTLDMIWIIVNIVEYALESVVAYSLE